MQKILCLLLSSCFISVNININSSEYAIKAAKEPIAFAIVREDSIQDQEIIKRYFPEDRISMIMVASGGCTAAQLISQSSINDLTLVDPNLAQLELTKFKIQLLTLPTQKRLEILGYLPMNFQDRKNIMQGYMEALNINKNIFGDLDAIALCGLDFTGRYEKVFEELRKKLSNYKNELEVLFNLNNIDDQINYLAPETELGQALDKALDEVMSQYNLVKLFGEKATANRVQDFSMHFAERIRIYLSKHLASSSAWLANMLLGHFKNNVMFPWLTAKINNGLPEINYVNSFMNDALSQAETDTYHIVHLSNIIDWLTPEEAEKTLELAYKTLKPGGIVVIRQLNSNVDIIKLGKKFDWNLKVSNEFSNNDRSFFYRRFLIGFKPRPSTAPLVQAMADNVLKEIPVIKGSFFKDLSVMDKDIFKAVQSQFYFAVNYFSRPMAALVARLPLHKDRIDIIHNIVEEHGDFCIAKYHANTFKKFLSIIDVPEKYIDNLQSSYVANMFNYTLMGTCANEDPIIAIACNGIIEYAFADISALIAEKVVERGWVKKENLIHYNLHADIDKQHAQEFFKLIEPCMQDPQQIDKIISGLRLGAYIFNRLYEDLYNEAKNHL